MAINYQSSLNSGELSRKMDGRSDLDIYRNGCSLLQNFYVLPQGGAERRTGTEFVSKTASTIAGTKKARMIPFTFSSDEAYGCEFGDGYIKVWDSAGNSYTPSGTIPYLEADLAGLKFFQRYDIMYIVKNNYAISTLSRTSLTPTFEWENLTFKYPPMLEDNETGIGISSDGLIGDVTLTATDDFFDPGMEGSFISLKHDRVSAVNSTFSLRYTGQKSEEVDVSGAKYSASWNGEYFVGRSKTTITAKLQEDIGAGFVDVAGASGSNWSYDAAGASPRSVRIIYTDGSSSPPGAAKGQISTDGGATVVDTFTTSSTSYYGSELNVSFSNWTITTDDTWTGRVVLQRRTDSTTWEDFVTIGDTTGITKGNFSYDSPTKEGANTYVRVKVRWDSGTIKTRILSDNDKAEGLVLLTNYTSPTSMDGTVLSTILNLNQTINWSEAAFSDYRGNPVDIAFHENRMWLIGSREGDATTIYGSIAGDYTSFLTGNEDDLAIKRVPDTPEEGKWLIGRKTLFMGTEGGCSTVEAAGNNELITAGNIKTKPQNFYGCSDVSPVRASDVVLYTQKSGKKLRELIYNYEEENFRSNDVTILNDEILSSGVTEMFMQREPDQIAWCRTDNGDFATLTYERQQEVVGWASMVTNGSFISGCAIPTDNGDEIWCCVLRNGSYLIEKFKMRNADWHVDSGVYVDNGACVYVDGITVGGSPNFHLTINDADNSVSDGDKVRFGDVVGLEWLNNKIFTVSDRDTNGFKLKTEDGSAYINYSDAHSPTVTGKYCIVQDSMAGLDHLEGMEVQVLGDGSFIGNYTVSGGTITLDKYYNTILAGLSYNSIIRSMPLEPILANRLPSSRVKGASKGTVKFFNTNGAKFGEAGKQLTTLPALSTFDEAGQPLATKTKEEKFFFSNDWDREKIIEIKQDLPYPMTVLSFAVWVEVKGG